MSLNKFSRRSLLGAGALGAVSLIGSNAEAVVSAKPKRAKNIIFCVSDGMSMGVPTMVDHLSQIRDRRNSYWAWLIKQPWAVTGLQDTRSLNSVVTDSSAASSSWGSGSHIWNGMVNMLPDKTELRTLTQLMIAAGVKCGLVTTATITHATPAGFCVNHLWRDEEEKIAEHYLTSGVDVLMGGGDKFFDGVKRKDKMDLYAKFAAAGYAVVKDSASLASSNSKRVLGIFSDGHIPYTIDRDNDPALQATVPTLADMAKAAIAKLKGGKNGFLLQIEGARIDHAAHTDDLASQLFDQMAFEEAVKAAVEFAQQDGETLVVVTSDHGNGNPGLNGAGDEYIDSTGGLKLVYGMKASYGSILKRIGLSPSPELVGEVVRDRLGIGLKLSEMEVVSNAIKGKSAFAVSQFYGSPQATLGIVLGNYTKVTWTSTSHTSDHVLLTAVGPGREQFAGLTQNVDIFQRLLAHKGIKHQNPTMSFEQAAPLYQQLKAGISKDESDTTPHWE